MSQNSHTSIFTTASGALGGVAKAVTAKPLLSGITLPGLANVVIYAAASAAAGYFVKHFMDSVARRFNIFSDKYLYSFFQVFSPSCFKTC